MLDDQCGAEPLSVGLSVFLYPFFRFRCERVEQEDGSLIGDENISGLTSRLGWWASSLC
jgi:hypothetical protein